MYCILCIQCTCTCTKDAQVLWYGRVYLLFNFPIKDVFFCKGLLIARKQCRSVIYTSVHCVFPSVSLYTNVLTLTYSFCVDIVALSTAGNCSTTTPLSALYSNSQHVCSTHTPVHEQVPNTQKHNNNACMYNVYTVYIL